MFATNDVNINNYFHYNQINQQDSQQHRPPLKNSRSVILDDENLLYNIGPQ